MTKQKNIAAEPEKNRVSGFISNENEFDKSDLLYRLVSKNSNDVIWTLSKFLKIYYVSSSVETFRGYTSEEATKQTVDESMTAASKKKFVSTIDDLIAQAKGNQLTDTSKVIIELEFLCKGGGTVWGENTICLAYNDLGEPIEIICCTRDITKRRIAEKGLLKYKFALEHAPDPVYWIDSNARIIYVNKAAEQQLGYSRDELLKMELKDIDPELTMEDWPHKWQNLKKDRSRSIETTHLTKDGTRIPVDITMSLFLFGKEEINITFARNISERKRMQDELQKTKNLESIGLLAGGIAHDFNNFLSSIYGYIEKINEQTTDTKIKKDLSDVINSFENAKSLTRQLLTFSKGGDPILKFESIGPIIKDAASFSISGSSVDLKFRIDENMWQCQIDKGQINQLISNIIINAKQAMEHKGEIEIKAENHVMSKNDIYPLQRGNYVRIKISDNGPGIPKKLIPRIFDPFFTTKKGNSGLGLSIAYSIAQKHGGYLTVNNDVQCGAEFIIFLPAFLTQTAMERGDDIQTKKQNYKGSGHALVMDDEQSLRSLFAAMLNSVGFITDIAKDGDDVIEIMNRCSDQPGKYKLFLLDLTVPGGKGGKEIISNIQSINPHAKIIAISGYAEDPVIANPRHYGFTSSIRKPFLKGELINLLASME